MAGSPELQCGWDIPGRSQGVGGLAPAAMRSPRTSLHHPCSALCRATFLEAAALPGQDPALLNLGTKGQKLAHHTGQQMSGARRLCVLFLGA